MLNLKQLILVYENVKIQVKKKVVRKMNKKKILIILGVQMKIKFYRFQHNFGLYIPGAAVNLENAYPIYDEEGKSLTPYSFTITNTCDMFASFIVQLEMTMSIQRLEQVILSTLKQERGNWHSK